MKIINNFKTIFHTNNWYYNENSNDFFYSDENTTVRKIYISIPFKNDTNYNNKLILYLKKFMNTLIGKIPSSNLKNITHHLTIDINEKHPVTITLKPIIFINEFIKIPWEVVK